MPPRPATHRPYRPPMRINRPNMNDARPKRTYVYKPAHSYVSRPVQRKSAVKTQSRVLRVSTVCCCCSKQVNAARPKAMINRRNWVNDVKASDDGDKIERFSQGQKEAEKPATKYAEMYRKTSKSSNVRGNQRNWNNLKSQQLGNNFLMKNKACYNCGEFDHLSYGCGLWVKNGKSSPRNNYTHKSMPPRPATHRPYRPPMRINRPNMNDARPKRTYVYKPAHSYVSRPVQRKSAVKTQSRVLRVSTVCCCCSKQVNAARPKAMINRRNWVNDVKASDDGFGNLSNLIVHQSS
nr:retrotransposon Orf1 [Tanacetum cinerariifolium]